MGLTPNQSAVRDAFVSKGAFSSDLALVRADLNDIGPERAGAALDSLTGEAYLAAPGAAAAAQSRLIRETSVRARRTGATALHDGAWAYAYGARDVVDGTRVHAGTTGNAVGLVVGADRLVGPDLRLGVVMETAETDLEQDRTRSRLQVRSLLMEVHASFPTGPVQIDVAASHGAHAIDATRRLTTGVDAERIAQGETEASGLVFDLGVSEARTASADGVRPYVGLSYADVRQDPFEETGAGDAGLKFGDAGHRVLTLRAGLAADWSVGLREGRQLTFGGHLGASEDLIQEGWSARPELIGGGGRFAVEGVTPAKTEISGAAWVSGEVATGWSLYGSYGFGARSNAFSQSASVGLRYAW